MASGALWPMRRERSRPRRPRSVTRRRARSGSASGQRPAVPREALALLRRPPARTALEMGPFPVLAPSVEGDQAARLGREGPPVADRSGARPETSPGLPLGWPGEGTGGPPRAAAPRGRLRTPRPSGSPLPRFQDLERARTPCSRLATPGRPTSRSIAGTFTRSSAIALYLRRRSA